MQIQFTTKTIYNLKQKLPTQYLEKKHNDYCMIYS